MTEITYLTLVKLSDEYFRQLGLLLLNVPMQNLKWIGYHRIGLGQTYDLVIHNIIIINTYQFGTPITKYKCHHYDMHMSLKLKQKLKKEFLRRFVHGFRIVGRNS